MGYIFVMLSLALSNNSSDNSGIRIIAKHVNVRFICALKCTVTSPAAEIGKRTFDLYSYL